MFLQSIHHAIPPDTFTQAECWEIVQRSHRFGELGEKSKTLLAKVLKHDNGIRTRSFAVGPVESLFDLDADALNAAFEKAAPHLAVQAISPALEKAGLGVTDLDALFVCTCTGYLCPGLSSYIAEQMGMNPSIALHDIVGQGCGAAMPTLRLASAWAQAHPSARIGVVAVEICSAAFYLDNDPGVLISLCLFGDGASASIWSGAPSGNSLGRLSGFQGLHWPAEREKLRFRLKDGKLRNQLHRAVPDVAALAVKELYDQGPGKLDGNAPRVIAHPGGRNVLDAIRDVLPGQDLAPSADVLRQHGNLSSPSVLFALEKALEDSARAKEKLWLTSFGAGFTAFAADFER